MIDNDSWRGGSRRGRTRRGGRSALLLVVGAESPDHSLLKVIHKVNGGTLNVILCLGNITTVGR